jgi:hypothetical protein
MARWPKLRFAKRERIVVVGGAILLILFIFFRIAFLPARERMKKLDGLIPQKEKDLKEVEGLRGEYLDLSQRAASFDEKLKSRVQSFTLFGHLESLASRIGIRDKIIYMKPSESSINPNYKSSKVEVKLKEITLNQLTKYLYEIERPELLSQVRKLRIKPKLENPELLDVTLEVSTYIPIKTP